MELILIKITSLPTENQEASICSQAIPYMRSDIFNFVYHLLNNEFLNNSEQEHFLLVKGNVLSRFQAHFSNCIWPSNAASSFTLYTWNLVNRNVNASMSNKYLGQEKEINNNFLALQQKVGFQTWYSFLIL